MWGEEGGGWRGQGNGQKKSTGERWGQEEEFRNVKREGERAEQRLKIKMGRSERRGHHKGAHALWVKRVVTQ